MGRVLPLSSEAMMARLPQSVIASNTYFEPFDRYEPKQPYSSRVREFLPRQWRLKRNGVWIQATPPQCRLPLQGWKIHISANLDNAEEILERVAEICLNENVTFKFLLDELVLRMCNSKNMGRGSSGKFITIYPVGLEQFKMLLERFYEQLVIFDGAYILSDKRYRDCKVLYYRYGGFSKIESADANGERQLNVVAPDGSLYVDTRNAYFDPPPWANDPVEAESAEEEAEEPTLKNGRYIVEEVLRFTNAGGVYKAIDRTTQRAVVIKEARPGTELEAKGIDACRLRRREWDVLCSLAPLDVVPDPIDFFTDWEHTYLVESFEEGKTLWEFVVEKNPFIHPETSQAPLKNEQYAQLVLEVSKQLVELVSKVHRAGVVIGDISFNNVLIDDDGATAKLIDLESAMRREDEPLVKITTPGFSAIMPGLGERSSFSTFEDDRYALGSLLMTMVLPIQAVNSVDPNGCRRFLESIARSSGLPNALADTISSLMRPDPQDRITLGEARRRLEKPSHGTTDHRERSRTDQSKKTTEVHRIASSIMSMYTPERADRMFHVSPNSGHALDVANGAMGIVKFLVAIEHDETTNVLQEALVRMEHAHNVAPGLFTGYAGIAWVLLESGQTEQAQAMYKRVMEHPDLYNSPDLYGGVAGVGMSCLKFWMTTGDQAYLDDARMLGSWLLGNVTMSERGARWGHDASIWPIGYAHGSSGISMFFLYLSMTDSIGEYRDVGLKALEYDFAHAVANPSDGNLSFPAFPQGTVLHPYWYTGSAGIGTAMIRYSAVLPKSTIRDSLEKIIPDVRRRYSVTPGLFVGLAGIANFMLDCRRFGLQAVSDSDLVHSLDGVRLFETESEDGPTGSYPGPFLVRLAADYAYGAAGIGSVLQRTTQSNPVNFNFMLDELLD